MALTNDPAPRRKPGRPRKVSEPEVEVRADLADERELESEQAPEYVTFRYLGYVAAVVVTEDASYDVLPGGELTLPMHAVGLEHHPDFVRISQ